MFPCNWEFKHIACCYGVKIFNAKSENHLGIIFALELEHSAPVTVTVRQIRSRYLQAIKLSRNLERKKEKNESSYSLKIVSQGAVNCFFIKFQYIIFMIFNFVNGRTRSFSKRRIKLYELPSRIYIVYRIGDVSLSALQTPD